MGGREKRRYYRLKLTGPRNWAVSEYDSESKFGHRLLLSLETRFISSDRTVFFLQTVHFWILGPSSFRTVQFGLDRSV